MTLPVVALREKLRGAVLDGGLATELETLGEDLGDALWSARLLNDAPHLIAEVHRRYLEAGADCIISASYQASIEGFAAAGFPPAEGERLIRSSIRVAESIRDEVNPRALVAASIGPYGACRADGSEYRGYPELNADHLYRFHQSRWRMLTEESPDIMGCETIPSAAEAIALARLADDTADSFWLSFSCGDGSHISDGTAIEDAARPLLDHPSLAAWGINCTPPQHISDLIRRLRTLTPDIPVVVYPNSGETWNAAARTWTGTTDPNDFAARAAEWRSLGAAAVGGCCRTGPAHIAALSQHRN